MTSEVVQLSTKTRCARRCFNSPGTDQHPKEALMSTNRTCSIDGCTKPHEARGWCTTHYKRWQTHGDPHWKPEYDSAVERFLARIEIDPETECWEWQGKRAPKGYGSFMADARQVGTHRFAYENLVAPIPPGFVVCHHCDNPPCVNPDHLFVGTQSDNIRDMDRKGRRGARNTRGKSLNKPFCPHGHAYTPENTYINSRGHKFCRECARDRRMARKVAK